MVPAICGRFLRDDCGVTPEYSTIELTAQAVTCFVVSATNKELLATLLAF